MTETVTPTTRTSSLTPASTDYAEAMAKDQIVRALASLQRLLRSGGADGADPGFLRFGTIPEDLERNDAVQLSLSRQEHRAELHMKELLLRDPRFEHLGDGAVPRIDKVLWRFICECSLDRVDHVPAFMADHAREIKPHTYFFPVEYLLVRDPLSLPGGVLLLPPKHPDLPANPSLNLEPPVGGVVVTTVAGTSVKAMFERARAIALHTIAVLRVSLRVDNIARDEQLRFRLAPNYALDEAAGGWTRRPEQPVEFGIGQEDLKMILTQPLAGLSPTPKTDLERKCVLGLGWLDRARLTPEPLVAILFDFFALEAILGDKAEGTKGAVLAFRTAFLSHLSVGHYHDPGVVFALYEQVRSAAVHGSVPPAVSKRDFYWFDRQVRESLNYVLSFAQEVGLRKRSQVIAALDQHEEHESFRAWLESVSPAWKKLLNGTPRGKESADAR